MHPKDIAPMAASFQLLNEDEVRDRFLHVLKALSDEHLRQLSQPIPGVDFVLVAAEPLPPGEALIVAVARLSCDRDDTERAEFGLLVSHFVVRLGLGRLLLDRLIQWAAGRAVKQIWGDVLIDNLPMLTLAERVGFRRDPVLRSQGLVRISLQVPTGKLRG
jgi:RimJ/RimL family protein N-acetyltransferase